MGKENIWPVILSGGAGTRLWPVSRTLYPKQLLPIDGEATMLQTTVGRLRGFEGVNPPTIVTAEQHRFLVADQIAGSESGLGDIILEPEGKNTAPAIALAAHLALEKDEEALLLVMPADHVIRDEEAFKAATEALLPLAQAGHLCTFGISPTRPDTGFGYIRQGRELEGTKAVRLVNSFVEKPNAARAAEFLESGEYLWNAGIFLFKASVFLEALALYASDVASCCAQAMANAIRDGRFVRPDAVAFGRSPSISVDHAVMERVTDAAVVPVKMEWSDVGSWEAVWGLGRKDSSGNVVAGDVLTIDTHDSLIRSESEQTIVTVGIRDIVAISTRDALLLMPRSRAQEVKDAVDALARRGDTLHQTHAVVHRPWGTYEATSSGDRFQTKRLTVKPGARLSLQMHHHRSEHWVVVEGTARVTVGDKITLLQENQSTYIPAGTLHRLENPGKVPLHIIEVQCGPYLGEDDIVRFEDDYSRLPDK